MHDMEIVVGRRRGMTWRKVGYGLYRRESGAGRSEATGRDLADLHAWQELLPPTACFTHLTGAEVHGLWLPPVPDDLPVAVGLHTSDTRPKRPELRVMRHQRPVVPEEVRGLRVAPVPEVLLAAARDLGLLDLVVMVDSALRRGACTREDLAAFAGSRRWGAPALQRALRYADQRAESPWESMLRMFHVLCGAPVEPQHEVHDGRGVFVARGDLWLPGTTTLHEYDGGVHRDRRTHLRDLARERALANIGWTRRGYTAGDLLGRAHVMLREVDAALGRPHEPRRVDAWRGALTESLFTGAGRARLLRRWDVAESGRW
jgi:hypothetical protein